MNLCNFFCNYLRLLRESYGFFPLLIIWRKLYHIITSTPLFSYLQIQQRNKKKRRNYFWFLSLERFSSSNGRCNNLLAENNILAVVSVCCRVLILAAKKGYSPSENSYYNEQSICHVCGIIESLLQNRRKCVFFGGGLKRKTLVRDHLSCCWFRRVPFA